MTARPQEPEIMTKCSRPLCVSLSLPPTHILEKRGRFWTPKCSTVAVRHRRHGQHDGSDVTHNTSEIPEESGSVTRCATPWGRAGRREGCGPDRTAVSSSGSSSRPVYTLTATGKAFGNDKIKDLTRTGRWNFQEKKDTFQQRIL